MRHLPCSKTQLKQPMSFSGPKSEMFSTGQVNLNMPFTSCRQD
uniref:Uncharacterized protein n=1 Tax=Anguilla anguilla TaxID=7936 RepID=A0A0E9WAJ1_ANGAN